MRSRPGLDWRLNGSGLGVGMTAYSVVQIVMDASKGKMADSKGKRRFALKIGFYYNGQDNL